MKKNCVGVTSLNDCRYAVLQESGTGCKFKEVCEFQRPLVRKRTGEIIVNKNGEKEPMGYPRIPITC